MSQAYKEFSKCRVCEGTDLVLVIPLGNQKVVDFVKKPGDSKRPIAPLEMVMCSHCKLVQLKHSVLPEFLYPEFWYRSGITDSMKWALKEIVGVGIQHTKLQPEDAVLDIGANDGTMLGFYPRGVVTCGIDPCNQIVSPEAKKNMVYAVRAYFNKATGQDLVKKIGKQFKVITAISMFYDLDDPIIFLHDAKQILHDDGVFIIQMNYLATMLKNNCVDNICHEHIAYYSFKTLEWALERVGFSVIDADVNGVNGGSLRVVLKKAPAQKDDYLEGAVDRIKNIIEIEESMKLDEVQTYLDFGKRVKDLLYQLSVYIMQQTLNGKKCYAYGASTRGSTLLQSVPLVLSGVAERDPNKIGLFMNADWLCIFSEEYVRERADIMLVLPWHFKTEIVAREKAWLDGGGTLVFPLPTPVAVTKDGEAPIEINPLINYRKPMEIETAEVK